MSDRWAYKPQRPETNPFSWQYWLRTPPRVDVDKVHSRIQGMLYQQGNFFVRSVPVCWIDDKVVRQHTNKVSLLDCSHIHSKGQKITKQGDYLTPISQDLRIQTCQLDRHRLGLITNGREIWGTQDPKRLSQATRPQFGINPSAIDSVIAATSADDVAATTFSCSGHPAGKRKEVMQPFSPSTSSSLSIFDNHWLYRSSLTLLILPMLSLWTVAPKSLGDTPWTNVRWHPNSSSGCLLPSTITKICLTR